MTGDRTPPHDLQAEKAVLGAILVKGELIALVVTVLAPQDFYRAAHQDIYSAMASLAAHKSAIDPITVASALKDRLEAVGGPAYLFGLTDGVPASTHIESYARIVVEHATLRRVIEASTDLLAKAYDLADPKTIVEDATNLLQQATVDREQHRPEPLSVLVPQMMETIEETSLKNERLLGLATGFDQLDLLTSGLRGGQLIIVAARPGVGKTSFCLSVGYHVAGSTGKTVGMWSLEMTKQELSYRLAASVAQVSRHRLMRGNLVELEYKRLADSMEGLTTAPFWIDDSSRTSVMMLRAKATLLKAQRGLSLVIVDYLQLMPGNPKADGRNQQIAEISRALKELAKDLDVPVIALSQLNRASEARQDKRPQLADLRESGALEQDADVVIFLYRPEMHKKTDENAGICEVIIGKQRNGPTGVVKLAFSGEQTRFSNLEGGGLYSA